jgi:hypothetical protein
MGDFSLDWLFNFGLEGLKLSESTPGYAKGLRALLHSAESP